MATAPAQTPSDQIHDLALKAEDALDKLGTALAHAGADQGATAAVAKCAQVMRKIIAVTGKSGADAPPEPRPTMETATNDMMAEAAARRAQAQ